MPKKRKDMRLTEELDSEDYLAEEDTDAFDRPSYGARHGWRKLSEETTEDTISSEEGWDNKLESLELLRDEEDQDWDE
jgi:hypothetical protein